MPSPAARDLTDLHRTTQAHLAALTVAAMAALWPLLDLHRLDATGPRWISASTLTVAALRNSSAVLAAQYLTEFRALELGPNAPAFPPVPLPPIDAAAVATSLLVTGPIALKSKVGAGMPWDLATQQAFAGSAAAAARHALSGGRDEIMSTGRADPRATGMVRVASPDACDFCVQIAEYSETNPNLLGDFQCHDSCHCQPELTYG